MSARFKKKLRDLRNGHSVYVPVYVQFSMINMGGHPLHLPAKVQVHKVINDIDADGKARKILEYRHGRTSNTNISYGQSGFEAEVFFESQYTEGNRIYDFMSPDFRAFNSENRFYNYYNSYRLSQQCRVCMILSDILDVIDPESFGDTIVYVNDEPHDALLCLGEILGAALRGNEDCLLEVLGAIFMKILPPDFKNVMESDTDQSFATIITSIIGEEAFLNAIEESGGLDEDSFSIMINDVYKVISGYANAATPPYKIRVVRA